MRRFYKFQIKINNSEVTLVEFNKRLVQNVLVPKLHSCGAVGMSGPEIENQNSRFLRNLVDELITIVYL